MDELKKFKINSEYEEKLLNRVEINDFYKGINTPIPPEHYPNSTNNLNHMLSNYNLFKETSNSNNPLILSGIKKFVGLSNVQTDAANKISNTVNPILLQPKTSIFKQSKMNLNSNIIKNITKRSSMVLNNLGFGLAFRRSGWEPTGSSPVLCTNCNNYYYSNINNRSTKPFNIGLNEDGTEVKNTALSNAQVNKNQDFNENKKEENVNPIKSNSNDYINMITDPYLITENNKDTFEKINNEDNFTPNKSLDKEMMISNSSGKTIYLIKSHNQTKNVSFNLNNEQRENLINNTDKSITFDKYNLTINKGESKSKPNIISNLHKTGNIYSNKNFKENGILKISKLKNYQNMNNYFYNSKDKKQNYDSKLLSESDASIDNASRGKFCQGPSPDLMDRNKFFNKNIILDSNKNLDLITTINNNINNNFKNNNVISHTHISKLVSTNNSDKIQLLVMNKNSTNNKEFNDLEPYNLRSKYEALRQSVISSTSNNNLKIIQNENFSELKLAKKEILLYKNCFDSITTDYKKLKSNSKKTEKTLNQEMENYRNLKEIEIRKFAKALEIYNELYTQQLKVKDMEIKQLAALIDNMAENENKNCIKNLLLNF